MKQYLFRIDDEYFTTHLTDEEFETVKKGINNGLNSDYEIKIDKSGEILEVGLIEEIKPVNIETKEITLSLAKEQHDIIKQCLDFYLTNWEDVKAGRTEKCIMSDGTVYTKEYFNNYFENVLPIFKKGFIIHEDVDIHMNTDIVFTLEVSNEDDNGNFGYINTSLQTINNELLIYNTSKHNIEDLEKGICFSLIEHIHNDNIIYELTDLGEKILSHYNYIIKFKIEE